MIQYELLFVSLSSGFCPAITLGTFYVLRWKSWKIYPWFSRRDSPSSPRFTHAGGDGLWQILIANWLCFVIYLYYTSSTLSNSFLSTCLWCSVSCYILKRPIGPWPSHPAAHCTGTGLVMWGGLVYNARARDGRWEWSEVSVLPQPVSRLQVKLILSLDWSLWWFPSPQGSKDQAVAPEKLWLPDL